MSKRGIRYGSRRVRLAVAAAVIAVGSAAGVVAVAVSHGSPAAAESAGFSQPAGRTMSYPAAISMAMGEWDSGSKGMALSTLSHMKPIRNYWTQSWHEHTLFFQRGTVLAVGRGEFAIRSADGKLEVWHVNGKTATLNVGASTTGMSALTGGTLSVPSAWTMNTMAQGLVKGDLVFVFGERENRTLKAQLVLFAAPMAATATPTADPTMGAPDPAPTATVPAATTPSLSPTVAGTHF